MWKRSYWATPCARQRAAEGLETSPAICQVFEKMSWNLCHLCPKGSDSKDREKKHALAAMRLKVFLKYSGFPIPTVGGLPWPKHTRNPIWLQENQSCRQMFPVFGYLSNFAASYPLLYWLYTHFCCFNLNFSRFNSPIWWLNPVQPLFLLLKNQVFSQRHP